MERTLRAAESILAAGSGDDFSLADVAASAEISVASIYYRFHGKDELIDAVIKRRVKMISSAHRRMLAKIDAAGLPLDNCIVQLVDGLARIMKRETWALRSMMARADRSRAMRDVADASFSDSLDQVTEALLSHPDMHAVHDPQAAIGTLFLVSYASLSGALSFGQGLRGSLSQRTWLKLKSDLVLIGVSLFRVRARPQPDR
jgi:AcrR family transcriptional regulator